MPEPQEPTIARWLSSPYGDPLVFGPEEQLIFELSSWPRLFSDIMSVGRIAAPALDDSDS